MKDFFVVALMLFSMFFGAGNFIFPPVIGASAAEFWPVTLAFTISAVALPVLGVAACAKAGDLMQLASRVHPAFAIVFSVVIYLCIGPLFAMPRASNMPLQLAISEPSQTTQIIYSAVYYLLNFYICLNPSKLIDTLGKIITPLLLLVLIVLITGVLAVDAEQSDTAKSLGVAGAFVQGYGTMDALAALVFGTSVIAALRQRGTKESQIAKNCIAAGLVAGFLLASVYVGLSFCGHSFSAHLDGGGGAGLLGALSQEIFGAAGRWVLSLACFLACFSTTLGLIGSGAQYFGKYGSYRLWVGIYSLAAFAMSTLGLNEIISLSLNALVLLYPPVILLIFSAFVPGFYWALRASVAGSIIISAASVGLFGDFGVSLASQLPGAQDSLGWCIPCAILWCIFAAVQKFSSGKSDGKNGGFLGGKNAAI